MRSLEKALSHGYAPLTEIFRSPKGFRHHDTSGEFVLAYPNVTGAATGYYGPFQGVFPPGNAATGLRLEGRVIGIAEGFGTDEIRVQFNGPRTFHGNYILGGKIDASKAPPTPLPDSVGKIALIDKARPHDLKVGDRVELWQKE